MDLKLTAFTAEYAKDVARLEAQCFGDPYSADALARAADGGRYIAIVALDADRTVGYAELYDCVDFLSLNRIEVAPDMRRRGIAASLLAALEDKAVGRGVAKIVLEVRASNTPARNFYEKHGFIFDGVRRGYYERPREDAALYHKITEKVC